MDTKDGHFAADEFRRQGHRMVDWIAGYLDGGARRYPVLSRVAPLAAYRRCWADPTRAWGTGVWVPEQVRWPRQIVSKERTWARVGSE